MKKAAVKASAGTVARSHIHRCHFPLQRLFYYFLYDSDQLQIIPSKIDDLSFIKHTQKKPFQQ
jgi:hypothetical protein